MCIVLVAYSPESQLRLPLLRFEKDGKLKSILNAQKYLSKRFKPKRESTE